MNKLIKNRLRTEKNREKLLIHGENQTKGEICSSFDLPYNHREQVKTESPISLPQEQAVWYNEPIFCHEVNYKVLV